MLYQLSYWPSVCRGRSETHPYQSFRFAMQCVLFATRTKLAELEPIRIVAAILFGGVISFFAITALKRDHRANVFFLGSHATLPTFYFSNNIPQVLFRFSFDDSNLRDGNLFYSMILVTTPAPTVRPPSRMANFEPCSNATGTMSSTVRFTLSPGITISTPCGNSMLPVTSIVRM